MFIQNPGSVICEVKTKDFTERQKVVHQYRDKMGSFIVDIGGRKRDNTQGIACHSPIMRVAGNTLSNYVSAYRYHMPGARVLWDYLTSFTGPFRKLMEFAPDGWVVHEVNGKIIAYDIPDKIFQYPCYNLLYAFFICTRMPSEFMNQVESIELINDHINDIHLSFILSGFLQKEASGVAGIVLGGNKWSGGHVALTDENFNYKAWRTGVPLEPEKKDTMYFTSKLWKNPKASKPMRNFVFQGYSKVQKTRFTSMSGIPLESLKKMADDFRKYIEPPKKEKEIATL